MGIEPISNEELDLGPEFGGEAPLWYYMLAESELHEDGERLGDVGARIVAEIFLRQLAIDKDSYLKAKPRFTPSVEHTGRFDVGEFLKFAGVVGEEEKPAES